MTNYLSLNSENIDDQHICCAISDKKCAQSYQAKKDWLEKEFENGYVFRRLDERAKVFIEYGPAENAWLPIDAKDYMNINCFWVSGKYKKNGHGKRLLQFAIDDAKKAKHAGLVTVVGTRKKHFMSDTKWLLKQGFQDVETTSSGFSLLVKPLTKDSTLPANLPSFKTCAKEGTTPHKKGIVIYYSDRCPFAGFHAERSITLTAKARNIPLKIIKLDTMEAAQNAPSPATIFSLFLDGKFVTTDLSVCLDTRFDKVIAKAVGN